MKLLSATDVRREKQRHLELEALRVASLNEQVTSKIKKINVVEAKYREKVEELEQDWVLYNNRVLSKKSALNNEVLALEERRRQALLPIKEQERIVKRLLSAQKEKDKELNKRTVELEKTRLRLNRLSDRLERQEWSLRDKEVVLNEKFLEANQREAALVANEQLFNTRLTDWQKDYEKKMMVFDEKEKVLQAGMEWVSRREEALKDEQKKIDEQRRGLLDTEVRLAKIYKELKVKGLVQ